MQAFMTWRSWSIVVLFCTIGCSEGSLTYGHEDGPPDSSIPPNRPPRHDAAAPGAEDAGLIHDGGWTVFDDFLPTPDVRDGLPENTPGAFAAPNEEGPRPCLTEPTLGALLPKNWTPPYFEWKGVSGLNVYELRLSLPNQSSEQIVYTKQTRYELPADIWSKIDQHSSGTTMRITLRAARVDPAGVLQAGPFLGAEGDLVLAPVPAEGTIVYWTTSGGSALKGFQIGQLAPTFIFSPTDLVREGSGQRCVGCHTSTPDGLAAVATFSKSSSAGPFTVDGVLTDGSNLGLGEDLGTTSYALSLLRRQSQTTPAFSPALYSGTSAIVVTVLRNAETANRHELVWTDLRAQKDGWGILARSGDPGQAAFPNISHDGLTVAYASSEEVVDGRTGAMPVDIYHVPYNGGAGGTATPVLGASSPDFQELYPAYSPDDRLIAFNRSFPGKSYNAPSAEIFLVPAGGGEPIRISGNDPPACSDRKSPGLTNSWARWSPKASRLNGETYYWLTFSSRRRSMSDAGVLPQLYISGVVLHEDGSITTFPAVYVRAQIETEANHTPAWDLFEIPLL